MRKALITILPTLLRLAPILLVLLLVALGYAQADGPKGPPDFDPV
ncbi:MAG: hypothetical protein QXR02_00460 [Acidilobaceae archaeon]